MSSIDPAPETPDAPPFPDSATGAQSTDGSTSYAPSGAEPAAGEPSGAEPAADEPSAEDPTVPEPSTPEPAVRAAPVPGTVSPGRPGPVPAPRPPTRTGAPPVRPHAAEPWGRVDPDGTVSVRDGEQWRVVGQFPDGPPHEALAYFERKFQDLAAKVRLLEQRHAGGGASPSELASAAKHLRTEIVGAAAVGDLAALDARTGALTDSLSAATREQAAAAREAADAAIVERTALVEKAEALAARDPKSTQWKQASTDLAALFESWQSQQQNGPRLPKAMSQQLWKRFRDARAIVERHRREFYAELDETHKLARDQKTKLAEKAEALVSKGEDGIAAYRALLDEWKSVGRAGKKVDDALWARFKAAGDALYGARTERDAAEQAESQPRIEAKRALVAEAQLAADEPDIAKARSILAAVQRRWDDVGRITPRERERGLDDELRKVENGLRAREEVDWKRNNPETKARAGDMSRQLTDAIEKLESELAAAETAGNASAVTRAREALDARRAWLRALGG